MINCKYLLQKGDKMKTLGHLIRDRRRELSMNQESLADSIFKSQSYIAKIKTDSQSPGIKTLNDIAEVLKIPKERIFEYDAKTRPLVSPINRANEYNEQWSKLSLEVQRRLLELADFVEKFD